MRRWLKNHLMNLAATPETTPDWLMRHIHAFADPWPDEIDYHIGRLVGGIKFPLFKPAAMVSIDDRAINFDGNWPEISSLLSFRPWNKRKAKK